MRAISKLILTVQLVKLLIRLSNETYDMTKHSFILYDFMHINDNFHNFCELSFACACEFLFACACFGNLIFFMNHDYSGKCLYINAITIYDFL
jgi:hypothetical protein